MKHWHWRRVDKHCNTNSIIFLCWITMFIMCCFYTIIIILVVGYAKQPWFSRYYRNDNVLKLALEEKYSLLVTNREFSREFWIKALERGDTRTWQGCGLYGAIVKASVYIDKHCKNYKKGFMEVGAGERGLICHRVCACSGYRFTKAMWQMDACGRLGVFISKCCRAVVG